MLPILQFYSSPLLRFSFYVLLSWALACRRAGKTDDRPLHLGIKKRPRARNRSRVFHEGHQTPKGMSLVSLAKTFSISGM